MIFEDDFLRVELSIGAFNIDLPKGMDWPPPEKIFIGIDGEIREAKDSDNDIYVMSRVSYSQITDDERKSLDNVARGAVYRYLN